MPKTSCKCQQQQVNELSLAQHEITTKCVSEHLECFSQRVFESNLFRHNSALKPRTLQPYFTSHHKLNCWHKSSATTLKRHRLYGSPLFQGHRSKQSIHVDKLYLLCVESARLAERRSSSHRTLFHPCVHQQDFLVAHSYCAVENGSGKCAKMH